ncbi:MAG: ABC transporter ATP-binding protein [Actinomycetaceae bacterium]|nr:ABC transporter ATP-binding protein [Actinomycetaceae bacterium]
MTGLIVENANVFYGAVHAVKDVSLTLPAGQIIALLGPSGSGKSSLLRAIAGLEKMRGRIIFADEDVTAVPVHRRGFGLMFQDGQLFNHRSVGGNVSYGLKGRLPREQWDARVDELLDLVGLPGYAERAISTLSGGQAQRVALARALAPAPQLLLLDEPLSALDRSLREQLAVEVRSIVQRAGTTAVYVTHDQDEAFTVADTIAILEDGWLSRIGTPEDVWASPGSQAVAQFLGYGPFLTSHEGTGLGVEIPSDAVLACGPDAFVAVEADVDGQFVELAVLEQRTVRGANEITVEVVPGKTATVDIPLHEVAGDTLRVRLNADRCALV